jgi:predicted DNA-binding protein
MHSTINLNDGYIGSGKILKRSIAKHGKGNHTTVILKFVDTKDELVELERDTITETIIQNPLCMNLKLGGEGGFDYINSSGKNIRPWYKHSTETLKQMVQNRVLTEKGRQGLRENALRVCKMVSRNLKLSESLTGKTKTDIHKENISISVQKMHDYNKANGGISSRNAGESNASYGTCYVTNIKQQLSIRIKKDTLPDYLLNGWIKGRKIKW